MPYSGVASIESIGEDKLRHAPGTAASSQDPIPPLDAPPMPPDASQMSPELTARWRELAEQRCVHFLELQQTGRWKHYYSEREFLIRLRDAMHLLETWNKLAATRSDDQANAA
jgi:hypothetical protein